LDPAACYFFQADEKSVKPFQRTDKKEKKNVLPFAHKLVEIDGWRSRERKMCACVLKKVSEDR
jgi:hypothetical protein